ncbi:hypothetical protein AWB78_01340 [Caballeronia calidae]|uniref:Uncharacterized protein n=1 Tax=Caballeronia calidae TaxID=1777139 RepID=A0A158A6X3_9BURK|nr:hypothetical protein [Caballeronia calidae]SAK53582.1 hypothetical protein AWB78_01340 [Caballeronia calidae]
MTQINEAMNLVVPVVTDVVREKKDGQDIETVVVRVWAYHNPIAREVFEANYRVLAATKAALSGRGAAYAMDAGPRIAALTLRDEGLRDAEARGRFDANGNTIDEAVPALLAEIKRLTNVMVPGSGGWDFMPVETAIAAGKIDAEDWSEAESAIVFFTSHWSMAKKAERARVARSVASVLRASITSSSPMEFAASLPSSTTETTSAKRAASSDPS